MSRSSLAETIKRHIGVPDIVKMGVSAAIGAGVSLALKGNVTVGAAVTLLGIVTLVGAFSIDQLRAWSEREIRGVVDDLDNQLAMHLHDVHAGVRFVPEDTSAGRSRNGHHGYDVATDAVKRAKKRIVVLGDYSPPPGEGPSFDVPPENRSSYLEEIERQLEARLKLDKTDRPFQYRRFLQRPADVYDAIARRSAARSVRLTRQDMAGDLQVFEHCQRVLEIASRANGHLSIDIRVIPFLPNAPSILLIDECELQFTIPNRIDQSVPDQGRLGLKGVLVMEDRANGTQLSVYFDEIFNTLRGARSLPVGQLVDSEPSET